VGIPQDEISDVFERFYRTDKARSTDTGGAGLGLAITKQIVDLHDGRIEVSSKLTEGSTFRVILPTLPESD
jgi:signal transduction histidine kinase